MFPPAGTECSTCGLLFPLLSRNNIRRPGARFFPHAKAKIYAAPKSRKKTQKTKHATRKAHMRNTFFSNTYAHRLVVDCPTYHLPLTSYHVQTRKTLRTWIFRNVILLGQKRGESNPQGACEPFTPENQFCFFPSFPKSAWIQITPSQPMMTAILFNTEERVGAPSIGTRIREL